MFKAILPSPFSIAILLTLLTFFIALFTTRPEADSLGVHALKLMGDWERGLFDGGGQQFAFQAMFMLVLGHMLALSKPVTWLLDQSVVVCKNTATAAAMVTFVAVFVGLINWGLGLIVGAIFARKVAESALHYGRSINYAVVGAAGYAGLMVWHGGLSGSAPIKIADPEKGTQQLFENYHLPEHIASHVPETVPMSDTIWSSMNIVISLALLMILPLVMYWVGKHTKPKEITIHVPLEEEATPINITGAERLDYAQTLCISTGLVVLSYALYKYIALPDTVNPVNYINFVLFGFALIFHGRFSNFLKAGANAIGGSLGILLQFPLYFGIMGLMRDSGLMTEISQFFVACSNEGTYPILTFLSAGLVNIFVPSGGGQWAVQGPIIIESATELGVPLGKSIMAMAYGDQLTNMLQPFWALPLLGITGLKAKQILPYTLILMVTGGVIFFIGLMAF